MTLNKCKLSDLGTVNRGKSKHRPRNDVSLFDGEYPFIQTGEVKAAEFYINTFTNTYNEKGLSQSKLWDEGTLLITIAANIAETAILDIKACFPDSIIGFIPYEDKSDVRFVKYYLDYVKKKLQNISQGTTQDNMSVNKLLSMWLYVPELKTQQKIASLLSNYDKLIENNTQRIKALESMAEELYKEWFVRLRFSGHEDVEMVDGVPEGWERKILVDIAKLVMGQSPKSDAYNEEGNGLPFHQGVTNYGFRFPTHNTWSTEGKRYAEKGDILFSVRAPVGRLNISPDTIIIGRGLSSIRHKKEWNSFLFYALKEIFFEDDLIGSGSIFSSVTKKDMENIAIVEASEEIMSKFNHVIEPIDRDIEILLNKNQTLKQTRELLLPRLMSGKLNVEDLDII